MTARAPERHTVKPKSANTKQTQSKSGKKYRPTDGELLDPDSVHFSIEWSHILSDFDWSQGSITLAEKFVTEYQDADIGHFPESNSPKVRIDFALNTIYKVFNRVDEKIDARCVDLEFVWIWGEYQKAVAVLQETLHEFDRYLNVKRSSQDKSAAKDKARQWYMLWYDWYKQQPATKRITRAVFNVYFEELLQELRSRQRSMPKSIDVSEFLAFIENFVSDPEDKKSVQLTAFFTTKFFGNEVKKALSVAKQNEHLLPPFGENNYLLIK